MPRSRHHNSRIPVPIGVIIATSCEVKDIIPLQCLVAVQVELKGQGVLPPYERQHRDQLVLLQAQLIRLGLTLFFFYNCSTSLWVFWTLWSFSLIGYQISLVKFGINSHTGYLQYYKNDMQDRILLHFHSLQFLNDMTLLYIGPNLRIGGFWARVRWKNSKPFSGDTRDNYAMQPWLTCQADDQNSLLTIL